MKIFVFSSSIYGGHEMMAIKIINALFLRGDIKILVIVNDKISDNVLDVLNPEIDFKKFSFRQRNFENVMGWINPFIYYDCFKLYKLLAKPAGEMIVINGGVSASHSNTLSLLLFSKAFKLKTCIYFPMYHSSKELGLSLAKSISYTRACKRVVNFVDNFITIDSLWKDRLITAFDVCETRVKVIHNYIPINDFGKCDSNLDAGKNLNNSVVLGFVGRFDMHQKGLDILLKVLYHLDSKLDRAVEFIFVGDGPYRKYFESVIKINQLVNINCTFLGWVDNAPSIIKNFDTLIMTSRCEGIPTVMVEALGLNVNVLAFNIPGVSKILPSNCLVDAFCVEAMAERILETVSKDFDCNYDKAYIEGLFDYKRFCNEVSSVLGK
ncbi:glycosyltransferase [Vibrio vulnificus]|uniref:glycosyltransferase n=1 Tax=Vibrio vulnificus TaxID=672 RepID=UPI001028D0B3|nr:glycosyltransferase [Vibrio vulnificus]RZR26583.1 glycosyltransferase [Vibrio vulnificus]